VCDAAPANRCPAFAVSESFFQRGLQQRAQDLADAKQGFEQGRTRQDSAQRGALDCIERRARDMLFDDIATDIHQPSVFDARRAGGFAGAAGQASIKVNLRFGAHFVAFQHFLHEVDAPTRAVQLIAEQLIGRARGRAEAAMHAGAQDAVRFLAFGRVPDELRQIGFHVN
jgi:hypothetical protein